jgi:hypothetical protein
VVEHRLGGSRRIVVRAPGYQHGEHAVTPGDRLLEDLGIVRVSGNDGDAP